MVQAHRIKAVAVVGCTAVGKSETALKLAHEFDGEIIGADSMQIYRGFDIGTGKLMPDERDGIVHKLIDIVDGDADFSVGEYVELADRAIRDTHACGKLPIIVGGTGLYVNALLSGCNFANAPKNTDLRNKLKIMAHFFGTKTAHKLLCEIDGCSADKISENDGKRIIRALEIFAVNGKPKSEAAVAEPTYDYIVIVLTLPRDLLYDKINKRVHKMFDDGLIEEAVSLSRYKNCGSMQALGYKQIMSMPDASRAEIEELTARKTRNYAKRQMTYFNNMKLDKIFIDARDYLAVRRAVSEFTEKL